MSDPGRLPSAIPPPPGRRTWSDLRPRLISAAVLIVVTAVTLYLGGFVFAAVVGVVFSIAYREWEQMVARAPLSQVGMALIGLVFLSAFVFPWLGLPGSAVLIAVACVVAVLWGGEGIAWRIGGLVFFGAVIVAVLAMRGTTGQGISAGIFLGAVIWMTDSAAFFTGRQVGGEKLAPDISPSKTWSGALGGLALGTAAGTIAWLVLSPSPWWIGTLLAAVMSILGQIGDLAESAIKRRFRIKDSGDIIPGHGGLMDRMDSLSFGALFLFAVGALHAGLDAVAAGFLIW